MTRKDALVKFYEAWDNLTPFLGTRMTRPLRSPKKFRTDSLIGRWSSHDNGTCLYQQINLTVVSHYLVYGRAQRGNQKPRRHLRGNQDIRLRLPNTGSPDGTR